MAEAAFEKDIEFLDALKKLYWQAAEKEVRCMILFHNAIRDSELGSDDHFDIACENFRKMLKLWGKLSSSLVAHVNLL
jgi:hypothetical protein